eukprot:4133492-Karenia_brevis.AAC.1
MGTTETTSQSLTLQKFQRTYGATLVATPIVPPDSVAHVDHCGTTALATSSAGRATPKSEAPADYESTPLPQVSRLLSSKGWNLPSSPD